jgi:hypothetical protein
MNEELLAARALLVQCGALLVIVNIKLVEGLQNLVFGWWYNGSTCNCLMLCKPKSAMAASQKEPQFSLGKDY